MSVISFWRPITISDDSVCAAADPTRKIIPDPSKARVIAITRIAGERKNTSCMLAPPLNVYSAEGDPRYKHILPIRVPTGSGCVPFVSGRVLPGGNDQHRWRDPRPAWNLVPMTSQ